MFLGNRGRVFLAAGRQVVSYRNMQSIPLAAATGRVHHNRQMLA
jgi:hypothetical protein